MHWRTFVRAIGAKDTAVTWLGFKYFIAGFTLVKPLARIDRHFLDLLVATKRAGYL